MDVSLREIREDDLEMIMNWRMDPDVTRYLNTDPKLTLEKQKIWLESIKQDDSSMIWLVEKDGIPVGIIQLIDINWKENYASWGYYIGEKKARSLELAISLEMSLYDYVFDVLNFEELRNEVFSLNKGVIQLHIACGSKVIKEIKNEIEKEGIKYDITHLCIRKDEWHRIRNNKKFTKICFGIKLIPHHIGYAVKDLNKSIEKYKLIGYYQSSEIYDDISRNVKIVFMDSFQGNQKIELISPLYDESPVTETLKKMKNLSSPYHMCYEVDDLEEAISALKQKGFIVSSMPKPAIAFENQTVVFLINKDAGLIELVEKQVVKE